METIEAIVRPDGTRGWVRMDKGIAQCRDHTHPTEPGARECPARLTKLRHRIPFLKERLRNGHALAWEDSKFLMEVLVDSSELVAMYKSRYDELYERSLKAIQRRDDKIFMLEEKVVEFADQASTHDGAHQAIRKLAHTRQDKINDLKKRVQVLKGQLDDLTEEARVSRRELHLLRENKHLSTQLERSRGKAKRLEREKEATTPRDEHGRPGVPAPQGAVPSDSWTTRQDKHGNSIRGEKAWDF